MINNISQHKDYNHIGNTKNLVKNFKVRNIIMNSGNNNVLEIKIIELSILKNINVRT